MREGSRANTLLLELLLVILFFMLAATTIVELYGAAKLKSTQAEACNEAMLRAENIAEAVYASENPDAVLGELGFVKTDNGWELTGNGYVLLAAPSAEETEAGTLRMIGITGRVNEKDMFTLPTTRYIPKEAAQ